MVFFLQTDEHTAPGATQSPLWYASQHLQDGEVISFGCTSVHCMYIPAETDHIDANLGSREPGLGFQHDPPFGKFNNQFHIVKLHEPKIDLMANKITPPPFRKKCLDAGMQHTIYKTESWFYNDSIWENTLFGKIHYFYFLDLKQS